MAQKSADEIAAHRAFASARNDLIDAFLELFVRDGPDRARLFADAGCLMFSSVLIGFYASHDEDDPSSWATHGRVQRIVVDHGVASRRRLDDLIASFRHRGYIQSTGSPVDKRIRILRPTELLLSHDRRYLAIFHRFLHRLYPRRRYGTARQLDPRTHLALRRAGFHSQALAAAVLRHRLARMFLAHNTGITALFLAAQATLARNPAALSFSAIARKLGVSHTHIRNIFVQAAVEGYVTLSGGASSVELLPKLWDEFDRVLADAGSAYDGIAQAACADVG